jgi:murein DD-endopeptidase MepM/ murein hydrolase activator NlpD
VLELGFRKPVPDDVAVNIGDGWWANRPGRHHLGIDILVPTGTPVLAVAAGTVIKAERQDVGDAGRWVGVRHDSGVVTRSMHFSRVDVAVGQRVTKGQQLGLSGATGDAKGPHLHFDMQAPAELLPQIEAAVGKPYPGWGPTLAPYGVAIPAEPWVPADSYRATTILRDKTNGVKLWTQRTNVATKPSVSPVVIVTSAVVASGLLVAIGWGLSRRPVSARFRSRPALRSRA